MKKSLKKALVVGSVFAAAMNFNACGYGPPDHVVIEDTSAAESQQTDTTEVQDTDAADETAE